MDRWIIILTGLVLLPACLIGQDDFWTVLQHCNDQIVAANQLQVSIDVSAYDLDNGDKIDDTVFELYADRGELYTRAYDVITVRNKDHVLYLDTEDKEGALNAVSAHNNLPSWIQQSSRNWIQLKNSTQVELKSTEDGLEHFVVKDKINNELMMECVLNRDLGRIQKLIQYPAKKVRYNGQLRLTKVVMVFKYQKSKIPLRIKDVMIIRDDQLQLRSKYTDYAIQDSRKKVLSH